MNLSGKSFFLMVSCVFSLQLTGQLPGAHFTEYKTVVADSTLIDRGDSWIRHWGANRRAEWATPVRVPVLYLDQQFGGLKPYEAGGGNETKSFRLRNAAGKEYALRSVNKSRQDVIPRGTEGSFIEYIINDGKSSSHPYGAFPLTVMQREAGILHVVPLLVWLPKQAALDTFNRKFGDDLYMIEQRPDGDWSEAPNFGYAKDFSSTEKALVKLQEDYRYKVDQYGFIRSRLFDMLIADWDRHEDNYRWARKDSMGKRWYLPVPRDRDQAFYTHNGKLLDRVLPMAGFSFMQHFEDSMGDMSKLNYQERYFDRYFSNEMELKDWLAAAQELQVKLTDDVITRSVRELPPEIFEVSGKEMIATLVARRGQLQEAARAYYLFIAKEVDVPGTQKNEFFDIRNENGKLTLAIYGSNKNNQREKEPYYHRVFDPVETSEIRIYGIDGQDNYEIHTGTSPIVVRVIGGASRDSLVQDGNRVHIYDNRLNSFSTNSARMHYSNDSAIHRYQYKNFEYDAKGYTPDLGFNYEDRIYAGLGITTKRYGWRKYPYASAHSLGVKYSISQNAISAYYKGGFPSMFGKWGLYWDVNFDAVRWTNFYGFGNNSTLTQKNLSYHRMNSREWMIALGIRRDWTDWSVEIAPYYQFADIKKQVGSYISTLAPAQFEKTVSAVNYGGAKMMIRYASVNDMIVPTRGFAFQARANVTRNFTDEYLFSQSQLKTQAWLPLSNKFSVSIKLGGAVTTRPEGTPESVRFYEYATIGGPETLRGFRWERFWGRSCFYNNNELRFITNMRSRPLSAKIGLLGFFDDGRVWLPGETSDKFHTSYGGGLLFSPFSMIGCTLTYGVSDEMCLWQFKINSLF